MKPSIRSIPFLLGAGLLLHSTYATSATSLIYGAAYHLSNGYSNWNGGYLDTKERGCEGNVLCVSTSNSSNRDTQSGTWLLLSADGKAAGSLVRAGDRVYLANKFPEGSRGNLVTGSFGGFLDTNGRGCDDNALCVSTAWSENRHSGSGTWTIEGTGGIVTEGQSVHLRNGYEGTYLDTRGSGCEGNKLCVSSSSSPNRQSGSGEWRFSLATLGTPESSVSWNDRMRDITIGLSGEIPEAGFAISIMLGLFWPESGGDIWSEIQAQVEHLVDTKILAFEIRDRREALEGIKMTMNRYIHAQNHEKASLLSSLLEECDQLSSKLTDAENQNRIHLLPLATTFSYVHLQILRERVLFGKKLYNEDNQKVWELELADAIKNYQTFFVDTYGEWRTWRDDQIEINRYNTEHPTTVPPFFFWKSHADIIDSFGVQSYSYTRSWAQNEGFSYYPEQTKRRLFNEANAQLIAVLTPTFRLNNFMVGHEKDAPVADETMGKVEFGPYSTQLKKSVDEFHPSSWSETCDTGGRIVQAEVREFNSIDAYKFNYADHSGNQFGNVNGGALHSLSFAANNPVNKVESWWADRSGVVMAALRLTQKDGTSTGQLGNRSGWSTHLETAGGIDGFSLAGTCARGGSYASGVAGLSMATFEFWHSSLLGK